MKKPVNNNSNKKKEVVQVKKEKLPTSYSDSDEPLEKKMASRKPKPKQISKPKLEADSESDEPLKQNIKTNKNLKTNDRAEQKKKPPVKKSEKVSSKEAIRPNNVKADKVASKPTTSTPVKTDKVSSKPTTSTPVKEEITEKLEAEEGDQKWFEREGIDVLGDGTVKWETLEHNGVLFPDEYKPLPKNVKMKYDGKPVVLPKAVEEVAGFFGSMLESDHAKNPTFQKNFFEDFVAICKENNVDYIKKFQLCDFKPIYEYYQEQSAIRRSRSTAEKKAEKARKEEAEAPYKTCLVDGYRETVGNFRVEPPSLFRGRGAHPKTGRLKARVPPEDITINIGKDSKIPDPPKGHRWGEVRHDNTVTWLAMWRENINGAYKYVFLSAGSKFKGQSDVKKYEKARRLKQHIAAIRKSYLKDLSDELMEVRQRATAMALIDVYALRAGNEKGEDEADTVGCCSLRLEHITLTPPNTVLFDFLGKDSIRYLNEVQVSNQIFKNLKIFKRAPKKESDLLFDRLSTASLNQHLTKQMEGLTAKVFRTYNASITMQNQLKNTPSGTIPEKLLAYNRANREVAVLCNHQRTVPKGHEGGMERLENNIKAVKYQKVRAKRRILTLNDESKFLKQAELKEMKDMEGLDQKWIKQHQKQLLEDQKQRILKRVERDNEKEKAVAAEEGRKPEIIGGDVIKKKLEAVDESREEFDEENKTGRLPAKMSQLESLRKQIERLDNRLESLRMQAQDKDENKTTSLGTSKINYIDPRITVAWAKKYDVPLNKLFTATLRTKFGWAMNVDADWEF